MLISYLSYVLVFHYLANLDLRPLYLGVQMRFWQQANLFVFIFAGIGISFITSFIPKSSIVQIVRASSWIILFGLSMNANFDHLDHSSNQVVYRFGYALLKAAPPNSIFLLNGDIAHNALKYIHNCEGFRPDLDLFSLQLMSWPWFSNQRKLFPRVVFPNEHYNPYLSNGFSMYDFLRQNSHRPIYLCGGYKHGDTTQRDQYGEFPFGFCERVLSRSKLGRLKFVELVRLFEHSGNASLGIEAIGGYNALRDTEETWEKLLVEELFYSLVRTYVRVCDEFGKRQQKLTEWIHSVNLHDSSYKTSSQYRFLSVAKDLSLKLLSYYESDTFGKEARSKTETALLKNIGVMIGVYGGAFDPSLEPIMFRAWSLYLSLGAEDNGIRSLCASSHNPYRVIH
jgi:hypothetical protein